MRITYIILLLLAIILPLCQCGKVIAKDESLELSLSFEKTEYKKTDPIPVVFKLENKGKKPIYANKRFYVNSKSSPETHREIYLSATSPSGEDLPFKESRVSEDIGLPKTGYLVLLNTGEEISSDRPRDIKYYFDFKELGTYKITGVYQNSYGEEIGLDTFKNKVQSDAVEIKIVE
ncbi:MAG: hypothetical protein KJ957_01600 [Candidatus Omnitrophica bacterium]|nr:hypothetical protein [Candidatus Omnitrophota bacterium]MBU1852724.1 hypothetical protein [Candidatus Omnitrophota bacterium]